MFVARRIGLKQIVNLPNDHRPAHVHVKGAEGEAVVNLNCPDGPPELGDSYGFKVPDVNKIEAALVALVPTLCAEWSAIHGDH